MERISVNELTTFRWSFEEDVANYVAAGIPAIGVWRQKLSDFGEEKGIELLADNGLRVSNLLWAGGFTGSDGRTFRESLADATDAIRLAGDLHCTCLVVYSGSRAGHTRNHARRLLTSALVELSTAAAEHNVALAIEPMHPACAGDWTFLTSVDDALEIIDQVGSPQIKLAFDTYHLCHDDRMVDRLESLVPHVAIVHIGDTKAAPDGEQNRCRLGEGQLPLGEIVARFDAAGYRGYFDVELLGEEIEATDYRQLICHCKRTLDEMLSSRESSV